MDQLATVLLAFPPQPDDLVTHETYHKIISFHVQQLDKLLKERVKELILHASELLYVVDPAVNSLSYLAVLHGLLFPSIASTIPQDFILEKLVTFMLTFDARQCRYAGPLLLDLMEAVGSGRLLPPRVATEALCTAILRLDPDGAVLTSSHILLAKLAYDSDHAALALPVLEKPIMFYPNMAQLDPTQYLCDTALPPCLYISKTTGLTALLKSSSVLEYDWLCGMIYLSMRNWPKAQTAFERAVTYPTKGDGCSKIMVEAFKRWVLVSLLVKGRHDLTSICGNVSTLKNYEVLARPYLALAMAFATDDVQQLRREAENNCAVWAEDGTCSLLEEVMASYQKWRILSLRTVFNQISFAEIRLQTKNAITGQSLNTDGALESLLRSMMHDGMLKADIGTTDAGVKYLAFPSPLSSISDDEFKEAMRDTENQLENLSTLYRITSQRLRTSKEYVRWVAKDPSRDGTRRDWSDDAALRFDKIDDEDLMGGLTAI